MESKKLRLRKLEAGGHEVLDEDGKSLGFIGHKELMDHVRQYHEGLNQIPPVSLSDHTSDADRKVIARARQVMRETGASYRAAFKRVLAEDESLRARYQAAHRPQEMLSDHEQTGEMRTAAYRNFRSRFIE